MPTYHGPNQAHDDDYDGSDELFGITEFEDELTPANLVSLAAISKSLRGRRREAGVRAKDIAETARQAAEQEAEAIAERLVELQVRDVRSVAGTDLFNYRHLERFPDLSELPHLIDDVHDLVYRRHKEKSPSPYISVGLDDILSELTVMKETHSDPVNYQRKQSKQAQEYFERLKIEEGSIHEAMASPQGRYVVRSLHRLFQERPMDGFIRNFNREQSKRLDERPVDFTIVAARALKWFERWYSEIDNLGRPVRVVDENRWAAEFSVDEEPGQQAVIHVPVPGTQPKQLDENDPEQIAWHNLRMREMDRARAFAMPVAEYLTELASSKR